MYRLIISLYILRSMLNRHRTALVERAAEYK